MAGIYMPMVLVMVMLLNGKLVISKDAEDSLFS